MRLGRAVEFDLTYNLFMQPNPYESLPPGPGQADTAAQKSLIRYKTFTGRTFYWGFNLQGCQHEVRRQAESFINTEIGTEDVVAIAENSFSRFTVTVWYRSSE